MTEPGSGDEQARTDSVSEPESLPTRHEVQLAQRQDHRHPLLRRGAIAVAAGLVVILALGVLAYVRLNGNITRLDVSPLLGQRPQNNAIADKVTNLKPVNILVIGSDSRAGTTGFGTEPGARADTTLIVHLAGDRKSAVVVSVPRDSMTRAPRDCKDTKGKVADGPIRQWNANFSLGGPACVIRAVEGNTGIFIDHFMVVNFVGFESMVDALGSVEVCVPTAVNDPKSHLSLPAGRSRVSGKDALAFVRVRHNIGKNGSDLVRIDRQQAFLSSMVQEATSTNLLLRPDKLFRFLDAATRSLTTDPGLASLNELRQVAQSVVGLKSSQVRFVTVPVEDYPLDKNRVQWTSAADVLWKSIRTDTPLPGTKPAPGSRPTPTPTSTPTVAPVLTVTPDKIAVHLSNDSGVPGLAQQAADDLRLQGFKIGGLANGRVKAGVTVGYSAANEDQARTVAAAFPGAVLARDDSAGKVIQVSIGTGSLNVVEVPNRLGSTPLPTHTLTADVPPTSSPSATIQARTADSDICAPK